MDVIKRVTGWAVEFGGEEHSGWLPPGAARPLPTPVEAAVLDVQIVRDGPSDCLLVWNSHDGRHSGDNWYATAAEAEQGALDWFGIGPGDWN